MQHEPVFVNGKCIVYRCTYPEHTIPVLRGNDEYEGINDDDVYYNENYLLAMYINREEIRFLKVIPIKEMEATFLFFDKNGIRIAQTNKNKTLGVNAYFCNLPGLAFKVLEDYFLSFNSNEIPRLLKTFRKDKSIMIEITADYNFLKFKGEGKWTGLGYNLKTFGIKGSQRYNKGVSLQQKYSNVGATISILINQYASIHSPYYPLALSDTPVIPNGQFLLTTYGFLPIKDEHDLKQYPPTFLLNNLNDFKSSMKGVKKTIRVTVSPNGLAVHNRPIKSRVMISSTKKITFTYTKKNLKIILKILHGEEVFVSMFENGMICINLNTKPKTNHLKSRLRRFGNNVRLGYFTCPYK
jgi:hypothetical protein